MTSLVRCSSVILEYCSQNWGNLLQSNRFILACGLVLSYNRVKNRSRRHLAIWPMSFSPLLSVRKTSVASLNVFHLSHAILFLIVSKDVEVQVVQQLSHSQLKFVIRGQQIESLRNISENSNGNGHSNLFCVPVPVFATVKYALRNLR